MTYTDKERCEAAAALLLEHREEVRRALLNLKEFSGTPTGKATQNLTPETMARLRAIMPPDVTFAQLLGVVSIGADCMAKRTSDTNTENGKLGAAGRWAGQKEISNIIATLAKYEDSLGDWIKPSDLWPKLYAELDALGLHPDEHGEPLDNAVIDYAGGSIKYPAFKKKVQRSR